MNLSNPRDEEYLDYGPVPNSLFSFEPLEEYLQNLTHRIGLDIMEIKRQMVRSADNAKHARMSVRQVKQFLSEKMPQLEKSHKAALAVVSAASSSRHHDAYQPNGSSGSLPGGGSSAHSQGSAEGKEPEMPDRTMTPLRPPSGSKTSDHFQEEAQAESHQEDVETEASETPRSAPEVAQQGDVLVIKSSKDSPMRLTDIEVSGSDADETQHEGSMNLSLSEIREDVGRRPDSRGSGFASRPGSQMPRTPDKKMLNLVKGLKKQVEELKAHVKSLEEKHKHVAHTSSSTRDHLATTSSEVSAMKTGFQQVFTWLGAIQGQQGDGTDVAAALASALCNPASTEQEMEAMVAHSPLLLILRRVILKDLSDRMVHAADVQSKDVSTKLTAMREEMLKFVTEEKMMSTIETHGKEEIREVVAEYERRLMDIELTSVRRQEFVTALKTKADSYLVSQQTRVGASEVLTMEKRMYERIAELEERVAYYEAERSELREIILSLLKVENPGIDGQNTANNKLLARKAFPPFQPRALVYQASESPTPQPSNTSNRLTQLPSHAAEPSFEPHEVTNKQIYRVMGGEKEQHQNTFATLADGRGSARAVGSTKANDVSSSTTLSVSRGESSARSGMKSPKPQLAPLPAKEELNPSKREMIGMTRNQEAYARFVTQNYNRAVVDNLPPIPYNR